MTLESYSRIGFVGAGKVAQTLASAFCKAGMDVVGASSRSSENLLELVQRCSATTAMFTAQEVVDECDLVFLTVADDAIAEVCHQLTWRPGVGVVHCSGATELSVLRSARDQGAFVGGFHPMQMFTNPDVALRGLAGCTVGVEADQPLLGVLYELAEKVGCNPIEVKPGTRALYHASAYYVGPFLIALLQEGVNLWREFGVDEGQALKAMVPLLRGTVDAVLDGGLAEGMGGCVARGDLGTIRRHLAAMDRLNPAAGKLYRELATRNIPLALKRGSLTSERATAVQELLTGET